MLTHVAAAPGFTTVEVKANGTLVHEPVIAWLFDYTPDAERVDGIDLAVPITPHKGTTHEADAIKAPDGRVYDYRLGEFANENEWAVAKMGWKNK